MAKILDNLKKKDSEEKPKKKNIPAALAPAKEKARQKKVVEQKIVVNKNLIGFEYNIIKAPHITEKASHAEQSHTYVFKVASESSKGQIRVAIQNIFGVRVVGVRTTHVVPKVKRRGLTFGKTSTWKKAYITLHKDDAIKLA